MEYYTSIGIDVSDRTSKICVMTKVAGTRRIVCETTVATTKEGLGEFLDRQDRRAPVTFETGVHCRWMSEFIRGLGFKVYVAKSEKKLKSYSAKFSGKLGGTIKITVKGKTVATATVE